MKGEANRESISGGDRRDVTFQEFMDFDPPSFRGEADPLVAQCWITRMENLFEFLDCPDAQRVPFATFMLEGHAEHWWRMQKRFLAAEMKPVAWKDFSDAFNDKFFPPSVKLQKMREFLELKQGNSTVDEYTSKFEELLFLIELIDREDLNCRLFEWGLKPYLRIRLIVLNLQSLSELFSRARLVERLFKDEDA